MNGPDLTPIDPLEVNCLSGEVYNFPYELYYAYVDLFAFWKQSEEDETLTEKIPAPKSSAATDLTMNDFTALGNSLYVYGYIG